MLRAIVIILTLSSCTIERFFPEDVANGVARLSVNNLGNLLRALNHEAIYQLATTDKRIECNFRSLDVTDKTTIHNDLGGYGRVVREFSDCAYDFGTAGVTIFIKSLCGTQHVTFFGKVRVSGTRTVNGILTGNAKTPAIPSGEKGILFNFTSVYFENYKVESSAIDKAMTIASGSAAFDIEVHLAKSKANGLCEIPLPNLTITNIRFSPKENAAETIVELSGPLGNFQATIDKSHLHAQVGIYKDKSNQLEGSISVWGRSFQVPSDNPALSPAFSAQAYDDSLACTPDLQLPASATCPYDIDVASGVARLTVKNLGNLVAAIADTSQTHVRPECNLARLGQAPTRVRRLNGGSAELAWDFKDCIFDFDNEPVRMTKINGKV